MTPRERAYAAHAEAERLDRFHGKLASRFDQTMTVAQALVRGKPYVLRRGKLFLAALRDTSEECERATRAYREAIRDMLAAERAEKAARDSER